MQVLLEETALQSWLLHRHPKHRSSVLLVHVTTQKPLCRVQDYSTSNAACKTFGMSIASSSERRHTGWIGVVHLLQELPVVLCMIEHGLVHFQLFPEVRILPLEVLYLNRGASCSQSS